MPPKKSKAAAADKGDATSNAAGFRWTDDMDQKLLALMTTNMRSISKEEHQAFAAAFGVPSAGGVRNRVDKVRRDHRKHFEDLCKAYKDAGLTAPEGSAALKGISTPEKKGASKGKKRAAKDITEDDEDIGGDGGKVKKLKLDGELSDALGIKAEPENGL